MTIQEKYNALMENEAFAAAFKQVTTPEEVVELFRVNGVEVPMEMAQELFEPALPEEGELSEDALMDVAGGGPVGSGIGTAIGNGLYYGAGYLGARLAGWDKKKSKKYAASCGKFGATIGGILGGFAPI